MLAHDLGVRQSDPVSFSASKGVFYNWCSLWRVASREWAVCQHVHPCPKGVPGYKLPLILPPYVGLIVLLLQRLMRDFKRLQNDPPQGVNGSPKSDSIMMWNAVIFGPDDTPWDGGKWAFALALFDLTFMFHDTVIALMLCRHLQAHS